MDSQNHLALACRNGGSHARITPDCRRGIRYRGISPSISTMRRRGNERLSSACRWTDFLERLTKVVAVTQNGLVDHIAALNAAPGPISCPYLPDIQIHAMLIHQQTSAPPTRNRPVSKMRNRSLRRSRCVADETLHATVIDRLCVSEPSHWLWVTTLSLSLHENNPRRC